MKTIRYRYHFTLYGPVLKIFVNKQLLLQSCKTKNDNKHLKQWYKTLEPGKELITDDIKAK